MADVTSCERPVVLLLAILRLRVRLGQCCVELHCGTVLGDEFCSSFRRIHLTASERITVSAKEPHNAIRHNTDPGSRTTSQ